MITSRLNHDHGKLAFGLALAALTTACGTAQRVPAPVVERSFVDVERPTTYTVRQYDTLYSIAWRHNLEYQALAAANNIGPPYILHVGQSIQLRESASLGAVAPPPSPAPAKPRATPKPKPKPSTAPPTPVRQPRPAPAAKPTPRTPRPTQEAPAARPSSVAKRPAEKPATPSANAPAPGKWRKPVNDRPERRFGGNSKGFDYALAPATQVRAAAGGVVVYAGPGLGGYQHLVIVKVSERYLVAYGFNVAPKLKEGDNVVAGAIVAEIASGGTAAGRFHFEIRDRGKPVDPSSLIAS